MTLLADHEPTVLSKKYLCDAIQKSRGSATGPSGEHYKHLKLLLDNATRANIIFIPFVL